MRPCTSILCAFLAPVHLTPAAQAPPQEAIAGEAELATDEALLNRLAGTVVDADYQAQDFSAVVEDLRQRHGLNIHVTWNALDRLRIRRDDRVTVTLRQVPLATVLAMICRELGGSGQVSFGVQAGVVVIGPGEELRRALVTRTYDVTDLIESGYATRRFASTPVLELRLTGREFIGGERLEARPAGGGGFGGGRGGGGGTAGGGSIFDEPGEDPSRPSRMERMQDLIDLLIRTVDPEDWDVNGGDVASISAYEGTVFIRHSVEGHHRIGAFFDMLRAGRPQPLDGEVVIARLRSDKASEWRRDLAETYPRLSAEKLRTLLESLGEEFVVFRAATSGFNGERMWFSALSQRSVLTDLIPIVGEHSQGLQPVSGVATEGLELIVLPLLRPGSDRMTLDVQMAWIPGAAVAQRPVATAIAESTASIDQVAQSMRTVSTTALLRLGEAIVLTIPARPDDQGRPLPHEDWLIVLVRRAALAGSPGARS
jgi:hypothetical protein